MACARLSGVRRFSENWLAYHRDRDTVAGCHCPRSRLIRVAGIPISTYVGHYGVAFPCYEMRTQFGDDHARRVCLEVARAILHQAARNRLGLVAHDDNADFAIPDTAYFVVSPLMKAAELDPDGGHVFRE